MMVTMNEAEPQSKNLGNGVRPRDALGIKNPIWRLGALVSLPYSIGKVILVQKPDRSLSLKRKNKASCDRRENVSANGGWGLRPGIVKPRISSGLKKRLKWGNPELDQERTGGDQRQPSRELLVSSVQIEAFPWRAIHRRNRAGKRRELPSGAEFLILRRRGKFAPLE